MNMPLFFHFRAFFDGFPSILVVFGGFFGFFLIFLVDFEVDFELGLKMCRILECVSKCLKMLENRSKRGFGDPPFFSVFFVDLTILSILGVFVYEVWKIGSIVKFL